MRFGFDASRSAATPLACAAATDVPEVTWYFHRPLRFVQWSRARSGRGYSCHAVSGVTFAPHTDQEMERCMAQTMEKWKFPTFQGDPVAFEQPVNLVAK